MLLPPKKNNPQPTPPPRNEKTQRSYSISQGLYVVKLFDVTSRGGEYKGRIQINPIKTGTNKIDPKDLGMDWTTDDTSVVYCINPSEIGSTGHTLAIDGSVILSVWVIGYNSDGRAIGLMMAAPSASSLTDLVITSPYPNSTSPIGYGVYVAYPTSAVNPATITTIQQLATTTVTYSGVAVVFINLVEQAANMTAPTLTMNKRVIGYYWGTFCGSKVYVGSVVEPRYDCVWAV